MEILFFHLGACHVREENPRNALQSLLEAEKNTEIIKSTDWVVRFSDYRDYDDDFPLQEGIKRCLELMFERDILDGREDFSSYAKTFHEKIAPVFAAKTDLEASENAKAAKDYFANELRPAIFKRRVRYFARLFYFYWDIIFNVLDLFILQEE